MVRLKVFVVGGVFILLTFVSSLPLLLNPHAQETTQTSKLEQSFQSESTETPQSPSIESPQPEEVTGAQKSEAKDSTASVSLPSSISATPSEQPPMTYRVQKGDTLWGISSSELKDPFLWPKLWKENRSIQNPDRIYPSLLIALPGALLQPQEEIHVESVATQEPQKVVETPPEAETETQVPPEEMVPTPPSTTLSLAPIPPTPSLDLTLLFTSGYILSNQVSTGIVVGAKEAREMLSQGDLIYLRPKKGISANIGDRWTAFKRVKRVYHPETGAYLGELIRILGLLEITATQKQAVSARVIESFDVIFRGDEVAPFVSNSLDTSPNTSPSGPLQGYIVEVKEQKVLNGQNDVVYLDKGRQHGVSVGDRFNITRTGERTSYFSPGKGIQLPGHIIGQIEVLGTQEITATARVLQSSEAIVKGDRIESP